MYICLCVDAEISMEQLKEDSNAYDTKLDDDTIKKVNEVYLCRFYIDPTKRY